MNPIRIYTKPNPICLETLVLEELTGWNLVPVQRKRFSLLTLSVGVQKASSESPATSPSLQMLYVSSGLPWWKDFLPCVCHRATARTYDTPGQRLSERRLPCSWNTRPGLSEETIQRPSVWEAFVLCLIARRSGQIKPAILLIGDLIPYVTSPNFGLIYRDLSCGKWRFFFTETLLSVKRGCHYLYFRHALVSFSRTNSAPPCPQQGLIDCAVRRYHDLSGGQTYSTCPRLDAVNQDYCIRCRWPNFFFFLV